jgi:ribosomal protein S12 methylthiotransferase
VEEAIETILDMTARKARGELDHVIVAGCFVQRYGYKLQREIPEVDGWLGTGMIDRIVEVVAAVENHESPFLIGRPLYLADHTTPRIVSGSHYSTYLKISEGCSHNCSFCTIPSLRGPLRSRTPESLVKEARRLAQTGVVELNLIAQDTSSYGKDLGWKYGLEDLLEMLLEVKDLRWIRLQYAHPSGISDRLLDLIELEERMCPYLDIPFQHVNKGILESMDRKDRGVGFYWDLLRRIRSRKRMIRIRTTLMVGFPGETDKSFEELCDFVKNAGLDYMGAFVFSPEKGSRAAGIGNKVPREIAESRLGKLMGIQEQASLERKKEMLGSIENVLVEGFCSETDLLLTGRTAGMAPDVDGRILINKGEAKKGAIVPVLMTEAHPYDLVGEIVSGPGK